VQLDKSYCGVFAGDLGEAVFDNGAL